MSVQLIIAPQSTEGTSTTSGGTEFIVDGMNFNTLGNNTNYDWYVGSVLGSIPSVIMSNFPPPASNTWYTQDFVISPNPPFPFPYG